MPACLQTVLSRSTRPRIAAIGITNQRETTVVWDKDTGKPVYNAIVWQCRRTAERCDELKQDAALDFPRRTGLPIDAYFSATKIEWILENVPGAMEKAQAGRLLFGTTDSWVLWKLTGGKVHATDLHQRLAHDALQHRDARLGRGDPRSLRHPAVDAARGQAVVGRLRRDGPDRRAPGGIPICGIAGDQQAALFGQACFEPGTMKNTYGTGSFILLERRQEAAGLQARADRHHRLRRVGASRSMPSKERCSSPGRRSSG